MIVIVMIGIAVCLLILLQVWGRRYESVHHSDTDNDRPSDPAHYQHRDLAAIEESLGIDRERN